MPSPGRQALRFWGVFVGWGERVEATGVGLKGRGVPSPSQGWGPREGYPSPRPSHDENRAPAISRANRTSLRLGRFSASESSSARRGGCEGGVSPPLALSLCCPRPRRRKIREQIERLSVSADLERAISSSPRSGEGAREGVSPP